MKLFSSSVILLAFIGLVVTSCQPAQPDLAQIKTEIQAMEDSYAAGLNAKDANAVIVYYASDAMSLDNNAPAVSGRDAILGMIQQNILNDTSNYVVSFEVVDVFAAGELATEIGKAIYKDSNGNVVKSGKYISLFEKRNGKYICIRDIYNDDKKQ